jgi:hypothetical protein
MIVADVLALLDPGWKVRGHPTAGDDDEGAEVWLDRHPARVVITADEVWVHRFNSPGVVDWSAHLTGITQPHVVAMVAQQAARSGDTPDTALAHMVALRAATTRDLGEQTGSVTHRVLAGDVYRDALTEIAAGCDNPGHVARAALTAGPDTAPAAPAT